MVFFATISAAKALLSHINNYFLAEITVEHAYQRCHKLGDLAAYHLESILVLCSFPQYCNILSCCLSLSLLLCVEFASFDYWGGLKTFDDLLESEVFQHAGKCEYLD